MTSEAGRSHHCTVDMSACSAPRECSMEYSAKKKIVICGRARCTADSSLSRKKHTVFQRIDTACRTQEAPAPPYWFVGRVRIQQHIGELGTNSAGKFGEPVHLGLSRSYSRNPGSAGLGRLVCRRI